MTKLQRIRRRQSAAQCNRCFYCEHPTWVNAPDQFALLHKLSQRQARQFRQTAEHLKAVSDGGRDETDNIVMACLYCNSHRHRRKVPLEPLTYRARVRWLLQHGRWHGFQHRFEG